MLAQGSTLPSAADGLNNAEFLTERQSLVHRSETFEDGRLFLERGYDQVGLKDDGDSGETVGRLRPGVPERYASPYRGTVWRIEARSGRRRRW